MSAPEDLSAVADKIGKMLALAEKAGTPEEAAAATARAQAWLEKYNLTLSDVAQESEKGTGAGKRTKEKYSGGFYAYERYLWRAVAELNFCLYFCYETLEKREAPRLAASTWKGREYRKRTHHQVVGRVVNVRATQAMASYLLGTVERLVRARLHGDHTQLLSRWAVSFREGAVSAVVRKVQARREVRLKQDRERELHDAEQRAAGFSTATTLSVLTYIDKETDANNDFLHGAGWSAKRASERAVAAAQLAQEEAEYAQWATENPEQAAAKERERRRAARRHSSGSRVAREPDWGAWQSGNEAGRKIGIDPQAAGNKMGQLR